MNYKKMWEQLKAEANEDLLKKMVELEKGTNETKQTSKQEIKSVEFNQYLYIDNKAKLIEELNKFSLEELKIIAKQKYVSVTKLKDKTKEQSAEILADTFYRSYHAGDCFRNCSAHNMFKKKEN
jgi:hypothetical protein